MFAHMQTLPIRYFDTHSHGEIMSHYTNDTDTLRQMIAQALPQVFSSMISIVAVFMAMLSHEPVAHPDGGAVRHAHHVASRAGSPARAASSSSSSSSRWRSVNGYIEEMMNGQKVVKVFCHEEQGRGGIRPPQRRALPQRHRTPTRFANILDAHQQQHGPYCSMCILAVIGAGLSLSGVTNVSLSGAGGVITLGHDCLVPDT